MKQYEAVAKVMEERGGFATLGELYQETVKLPDVSWGTKTPDASIRRIVQTHPDKFFKVQPGLWALCGWEDRLPEEMKAAQSAAEKEEQPVFTHSYYQGLILQIGNMQRFETYIPPQDKNRLFLQKQSLASLASCAQIYRFTYDSIVNKATNIDVIWFNDRKLPAALFEVEHTTDMTRALVKFNELRDFRARMYIVASANSEARFKDLCAWDTFRQVSDFITFLSYERLSKSHSQVSALQAFGEGVQGVYAVN